MRAQAGQFFDGLDVGTVGLGTKIPGEYAKVVLQLAESANENVGECRIPVQVRVADLENSKPLERCREMGKLDVVVANLKPARIALAATC